MTLKDKIMGMLNKAFDEDMKEEEPAMDASQMLDALVKRVEALEKSKQEDAPAEVVKTALRAANLIGDGLYGVDLKQTEKGVVVIEVNDNPSIDAGVEDEILKDELYRTLIEDFIARLDLRRQVPRPETVTPPASKAG